MYTCPFCPVQVADLQGHLALCDHAPMGLRALALAAVAIRQRMALADGAEQALLVQRLGEAIADAICDCSPMIPPEQEFLVAFDNFWLLGDQAQLAALAEAQTHVRESAVERWRFLRRPRA